MTEKKNRKDKIVVLALLLLAAVILVMPVLFQKGAEFRGSDDAGSQMAEQLSGEYTPWFTPILEKIIGGELPGEVETLMFCIQTGIGVGIFAFFMGRLVERKKQEKIKMEQEEIRE